MTEPRPIYSLSLSLDKASILQQIKEGYLLWIKVMEHMPRGQRYTIGTRIENKFLDFLELAYIAYFTPKERKVEKIDACILTLDTLKFLIHVSWEAKSIAHAQCAIIATKLDEVGRMFGGWKKNAEYGEKKNRTL